MVNTNWDKMLKEAAEHYEQTTATKLACEYGWGDAEIEQQCFIEGAKWAMDKLNDNAHICNV
jgi:hypothetical protein